MVAKKERYYVSLLLRQQQRSIIGQLWIYEQRRIGHAFAAMAGNSRLFTFNVEDRPPDFSGIYHIRLRSATDYWGER